MIQVAIVEDHPVFRLGLAQILKAISDFDVVSVSSSIEQFDETSTAAPDVVVLDLGLPGLSGADGVAHVRATGPAVLVVSAAAPQDHVLDAIASGASGYLTKDAQPTEIEAAIRTISSGGTYVSPTLASYLLQATKPTTPDRLNLSEREREILTLVAQGERDQDIAEALYLSVRTVRSHLDRIRDKTGRRRRPDLTRLALEEGLVGRNSPGEK